MMRRLLFITIISLTFGTLWLFVFGDWQLPKHITDFGEVYDSQFNLTMIVIGVAFLLFQVLLSFILLSKNQSPITQRVNKNHKIEIGWTIFTATVFLSLAFLGQRVWGTLLKPENKQEVFKVEVSAQQFQWNFHYAGSDNIFGQTNPSLINDAELNYIGLDSSDSNAKDDIVSSVLIVPVNQTIELTMKSRDVTHSFWVAPLRFKQDLVPGLITKISFRPTSTGKYEIACAELCGISHYKMKSYLLIVNEHELRSLILLTQDDFQKRVSELLNLYQLSL